MQQNRFRYLYHIITHLKALNYQFKLDCTSRIYFALFFESLQFKVYNFNTMLHAK